MHGFREAEILREERGGGGEEVGEPSSGGRRGE